MDGKCNYHLALFLKATMWNKISVTILNETLSSQGFLESILVNMSESTGHETLKMWLSPFNCPLVAGESAL